MSRRRIVATIEALDQATQKGTQLASSLSGDLDRIAHGSASASSQKLFGVIGAGLGATSAIGLAVVTGVSAVLVAPVFMALGGAVGVLAWRGRKGVRLEKEMHYRATMLETIKSQIRTLPSSTPKSVREGLWAEYQAIVNGYGTASVAALAPPTPVRGYIPKTSTVNAVNQAQIYQKSERVVGEVYSPNTGPQADG